MSKSFLTLLEMPAKNEVDIADLQVLAQYWLHWCNGPGWCSGIDLNRNDKVIS